MTGAATWCAPRVTSYTSPAGNGSTYAFSSNVWKAGDYYQAAFSGTGYSGLSFSWDFTRSTTGPATWEVIMSVDGGTHRGKVRRAGAAATAHHV